MAMNRSIHEILEHLIGQLESLRPMVQILPIALQQRYNFVLKELGEIALAARAKAQGEEVPAAIIAKRPLFSPEFVKAVDFLSNEEIGQAKQIGYLLPCLAIYIRICIGIFPETALRAASKNRQLDAAAIIASIEELLHISWIIDSGGKMNGQLYIENLNTISYNLPGKRRLPTKNILKDAALYSVSQVIDKTPDDAVKYATDRLRTVFQHEGPYGIFANVHPSFLSCGFAFEEYFRNKRNSTASEKMGFSMLASAMADYYLKFCN